MPTITVFEKSFPDIKHADLIILGCNDARGEGFGKPLPIANTIRSEFYALYHWHKEISVADIALSGIQGITFTSKSDANCILYRDSKGVYLDFIKREETDLGSRVAHLTEKKIKIAEILTAEELQAGNTPITYWEEIYKDLITIKK